MDKKIVAYIFLGIIILMLALFTFFPGMVHSWKDSKVTGNAVEDICKPGPGYTEESWREHMSHHPKIYSECLT